MCVCPRQQKRVGIEIKDKEVRSTGACSNHTEREGRKRGVVTNMTCAIFQARFSRSTVVAGTDSLASSIILHCLGQSALLLATYNPNKDSCRVHCMTIPAVCEPHPMVLWPSKADLRRQWQDGRRIRTAEGRWRCAHLNRSAAQQGGPPLGKEGKSAPSQTTPQHSLRRKCADRTAAGGWSCPPAYRQTVDRRMKSVSLWSDGACMAHALTSAREGKRDAGRWWLVDRRQL